MACAGVVYLNGTHRHERMQAPATHALLQKVDRVLAALMTQENTDGAVTIKMGTKYFDNGMNKFFPESSRPKE